MSVRSFHSVFMASAVAGAALGCYLVSLRVASERAALDAVENQIVLAQRDIRLLQTEIGTRGRLAQLERWNVRVLALSAPTADQILGDKFQLASLIQPQRKLPVDAPVVLASAPAPQPQQPLGEPAALQSPAPVAQLLHEASAKLPVREVWQTGAPAPAPVKPAATKPEPRKAAETKPAPKRPDTKALPQTKTLASKDPEPKAFAKAKKAGDKSFDGATAAVTRPVRTAKLDPLAPLPAERSTAKGSRTNR